jgi:hypothetical protein
LKSPGGTAADPPARIGLQLGHIVVL